MKPTIEGRHFEQIITLKERDPLEMMSEKQRRGEALAFARAMEKAEKTK